MNIFDIIGPVMIGPSSSHTAGAARIGYISRLLLSDEVERARISLHGSFASTGLGHGTDKAIVAGILGMKCDDDNLKNSLELAKENGIKIDFDTVDLDNAHPNTAVIHLQGKSKNEITITGASVGGGNIKITSINGNNVNISGKSPTMIISLTDVKGIMSKITYQTAECGYNISEISVARDKRGGKAILCLEFDGNSIDQSLKDKIMEIDRVENVIILQGE